MKTAVIYARYSSDSQTEQSIDGQLRVCEEYAKKNNILIVQTYIDRAMTGTNDKRPDFQQMLKDSYKKQWDYAVMFPAWMKYVYKHDVKRFVQFATRVWDVDPAGKTDEQVALEGIQAMQNFFISLGMPATLEQAGGCREDIPALAAKVVNGRTGNFVKLLPPQIEEVYALACER